jgi:hypothetical protein
MWVDRQTYRQTDRMKLIDPLPDFVNAPRNGSSSNINVFIYIFIKLYIFIYIMNVLNNDTFLIYAVMGIWTSKWYLTAKICHQLYMLC